MIPTIEENPQGLHQRYEVRRRDGKAEPGAVYFVLRLDRNGSDADHAEACRYAALKYHEYVMGLAGVKLPPETPLVPVTGRRGRGRITAAPHHLMRLAGELRNLVRNLLD